MTCPSLFFFGRIGDLIGRKYTLLVTITVITSYIQMTATLGLVLALLVVVGTETAMGEAAFSDFGWRIPFWLSGLLVVLPLYIRLSLRETPLYTKIKEAKKHSVSPIKDALQLGGWKRILLVLLAATAGQAVLGKPISVALMTVVVGYFTLRETHHIRICDEVSEATPATGDRPAEVVVDKSRPREAT